MALQRERATEEEEEVIETDPRTPGPTSNGGRGVGAWIHGNPGPTSNGGHGNRDDESPPGSSTPGSGAELTRRDLHRVKRRFISVSEHLRESLADTHGPQPNPD